jgi:hypothetical protein
MLLWTRWSAAGLADHESNLNRRRWNSRQQLAKAAAMFDSNSVRSSSNLMRATRASAQQHQTISAGRFNFLV